MDNKVCYNILEQLKKQMIGVISALILIFAATWSDVTVIYPMVLRI